MKNWKYYTDARAILWLKTSTIDNYPSSSEFLLLSNPSFAGFSRAESADLKLLHLSLSPKNLSSYTRKLCILSLQFLRDLQFSGMLGGNWGIGIEGSGLARRNL